MRYYGLSPAVTFKTRRGPDMGYRAQTTCCVKSDVGLLSDSERVFVIAAQLPFPVVSELRVGLVRRALRIADDTTL